MVVTIFFNMNYLFFIFLITYVNSMGCLFSARCVTIWRSSAMLVLHLSESPKQYFSASHIVYFEKICHSFVTVVLDKNLNLDKK